MQSLGTKMLSSADEAPPVGSGPYHPKSIDSTMKLMHTPCFRASYFGNESSSLNVGNRLSSRPGAEAACRVQPYVQPLLQIMPAVPLDRKARRGFRAWVKRGRSADYSLLYGSTACAPGLGSRLE